MKALALLSGCVLACALSGCGSKEPVATAGGTTNARKATTAPAADNKVLIPLAMQAVQAKLPEGATAKFPDVKQVKHRTEGESQIYSGDMQVTKDGGKTWTPGSFSVVVSPDPAETKGWKAELRMLGFKG